MGVVGRLLGLSIRSERLPRKHDDVVPELHTWQASGFHDRERMKALIKRQKVDGESDPLWWVNHFLGGSLILTWPH